MAHWTKFPDKEITEKGPVTKKFINLGITCFHAACEFVHDLPYGYNSDRDDLMILFKEKMGTCTTKHAVIATLAEELQLPVVKHIGIYAMNEDIVSGSDEILTQFALPYIPMVHCFLANGSHRVDLTEGNDNGKKGPINAFLYDTSVEPNISAKKEYLLYRDALNQIILKRQELRDATIRQVLQARELGLKLLKRNIEK